MRSGWTEGLLACGYDVIGFDNEHHEYWVPDNPENAAIKGTRPVPKRGITQGCAVSLGLEGAGKRPLTKLLRYPGQLVIQDVLTLHGSQFKDATLIVASPPCQEYSYMAMPWRRAKQIERALKGEDKFPEGYTGSRTIPDLNRLFDACFRIQREACEAAGRHIPLVVENVRGAQKWVGRSRWNYGSYHLWGDVPALMPMARCGAKNRTGTFTVNRGQGAWNRGEHIGEGTKNTGGSWFNIAHNTTSGKGRNPDGQKAPNGTQWFNDGPRTPDSLASSGSKSTKRKAASALIAKIPFELARHIAAVYRPLTEKD